MSAPISDPSKIEADQTFSWEMEQIIELDSDAREPYFISLNDKLYFNFF